MRSRNRPDTELDGLADGQLHGQALAALEAAALQYVATTGRRHARAKSMGLEALANFRLPGAFCSHDMYSLNVLHLE